MKHFGQLNLLFYIFLAWEIILLPSWAATKYDETTLAHGSCLSSVKLQKLVSTTNGSAAPRYQFSSLKPPLSLRHVTSDCWRLTFVIYLSLNWINFYRHYVHLNSQPATNSGPNSITTVPALILSDNGVIIPSTLFYK